MVKQERKEWQIYKVELAKLPNKSGGYEIRWYIYKNNKPAFKVNEFLDEASIRKVSTGKKYAYSLVKFLNYLNLIGKTYETISVKTLKDYIKWQIFGLDGSLTVRNIEAQVSYSTLEGDIAAITGFYKYLYTSFVDTSIKPIIGKETMNSKALLYGQIFQRDYSKILDKYIRNLKGSKEYYKWYTEEQKEIILDNLKTLRDKVIFLIQLEGFRIDEVLSMRLMNYNDRESTVQPSRSKGKANVEEGEENILRIIPVSSRTSEYLNDYILTERATAVNESNRYSDLLFVNLRKDENQGNPLSQDNYRKILKTASERGGLDPKQIRTHSGRSTKVNELLEIMVTYPEKGVNEIIIKNLMGWKRIDSLDPYKKNNNRTIAREVSKKAQAIRIGDNNGNRTK